MLDVEFTTFYSEIHGHNHKILKRTKKKKRIPSLEHSIKMHHCFNSSYVSSKSVHEAKHVFHSPNCKCRFLFYHSNEKRVSWHLASTSFASSSSHCLQKGTSHKQRAFFCHSTLQVCQKYNKDMKTNWISYSNSEKTNTVFQYSKENTKTNPEDEE